MRHIDRFERQYNKAFARDPLFGADLIDRIHKRVKVFLHSCNTTEIEEVDSGSLEEFRGLQKRVERGKRITSTPVWVERPETRVECHWNFEGNGIGSRQGVREDKEDTVFNHGVDPQLRISENLRLMT